MKVHFGNVHIRPRLHKKQLLQRFSEVLESGMFFDGKETRRLEKRLVKHFGRGYVTLVGSGHDSLSLALQAIGCTARDEVIIPANVYPTAFPVALSGAKPVLVDADHNGLISADAAKEAITSRTKAVIAVHLYGLAADIAQIKRVTKPQKIVLIEDCAQAFGTTYRDRPVGTLGDIGCFSFYPTKNLGALGDGGALWTASRKLHDYFEQGKSYGEKKRYDSRFVSGHSRLSELQAAALNVHLDQFRAEHRTKNALLKHYLRTMKKKLNGDVSLVYHEAHSKPLMHLLVLKTNNRNRLKKFLEKKGIQTQIHYPHPVHAVQAFSYLNHDSGSFPNTDSLAASILSIPFHTSLTKRHIEYVVDCIARFYEKND